MIRALLLQAACGCLSDGPVVLTAITMFASGAGAVKAFQWAARTDAAADAAAQAELGPVLPTFDGVRGPAEAIARLKRQHAELMAARAVMAPHARDLEDAYVEAREALRRDHGSA